MVEYNKLKQGMIFANYVALCKFLDIKSLNGKSRALHLNRIGKHVNFHRDGRKIIIDGINMEASMDLSSGCYSQHIQPLILSLLYSKYLDVKKTHITMSVKQLAFEVGMTNDQYKLFAHRQSTLAQETNIPIEDISSFYDMYESKMSYNITNSLEDMAKKGLIKLRPILIQVYMGNNKQKAREVMSKDELGRISTVEKRVLSKYGVSKSYDLHLNGKLYLYRRDLRDAINAEFKTDNILYHYPAFKLSLSKDLLYDEQLMEYLMEKREIHINELNSILIDKCKNYYSKRKNKAIDKLEFEIGDLNPYKVDEYKYRTTDQYIINGHSLIDRLIKINSP